MGSVYYLEGEFGRGARSDGTERAPEVDGGGKRTGGQQDRSLDGQTDTEELIRTKQINKNRQTDGRTSVYQSVGGDDSRGERVGR